MKPENYVYTFFVVMLVFIVGVVYGAYRMENAMRTTAINHGVAYYTVNSTNGETSFVWKDK